MLIKSKELNKIISALILMDIHRTLTPKDSRYLFFWYTRNIYKNWSYSGPLSNSQNIAKDWNNIEIMCSKYSTIHLEANHMKTISSQIAMSFFSLPGFYESINSCRSLKNSYCLFILHFEPMRSQGSRQGRLQAQSTDHSQDGGHAGWHQGTEAASGWFMHLDVCGAHVCQ